MPYKQWPPQLPLVAALLLLAGGAGAQNYPTKPVRVITAEAGGGSDFGARAVAQALSGRFGQQFIVDNRGNTGPSIVAAAQPDGYTLLFYGTNVWLSPLMRKTPWDPLKDFATITLAVSSPNVLVVSPSFSANSVKELIDLAKSRPGALNYASGGAGASSQLAAELFKSMTGTNIVRIAYRGNGPAVTGLIVGEVQLMFGTAASVNAHVKAGRLKALAITSTSPSSLFPGLPTVQSTIPGYESTSRWGLFAPAKLPLTLVKTLNQEAVRGIGQPEIKERFFSVGVETVGSTPEEFRKIIEGEMQRMGKVIKDAGIKEE